ncbi:MAG: nitronate monooxygenase [Gammaproteobacteria bacterium]
MWHDRRILDLLDIEHPIIQAPMASASNAELVAAVSEAGGLGSFGAAGTPPDRLRTTVQAIRQRTDRVFNINLFSAHAEEFDRSARPGPGLAERLKSYHEELGIGAVPDPAPIHPWSPGPTKPEPRCCARRPRWRSPSSCLVA